MAAKDRAAGRIKNQQPKPINERTSCATPAMHWLCTVDVHRADTEVCVCEKKSDNGQAQGQSASGPCIVTTGNEQPSHGNQPPINRQPRWSVEANPITV